MQIRNPSFNSSSEYFSFIAMILICNYLFIRAVLCLISLISIGLQCPKGKDSVLLILVYPVLSSECKGGLGSEQGSNEKSEEAFMITV